MSVQQDKDSSQVAIGLVEDEPNLRDELVFQLQHRGFSVVAFADATRLYRYLATRPLAVVLLDIGLPGEDGLSIAKLLRSHSPFMGIVFVTARGLREERLDGLSAGADGYLVKPIDIDELELLLRRLLDRFAHAQKLSVQASQKEQGSQEEEHWKLQASTAVLLAPDGTKVRLTLTELQLVTELFQKKGQACKHAELARAMGLLPDEWDRHRLEVIVSRLRIKVERATGFEAPIRSVRGVGYAWAAN